MLKKAGILVVTAAAGVLAVSSFAFADETVNKDNLTTTCNFTASGAGESAASSTSLLGAVGATTSAVVNTVAQAPALSCNNLNIEDVIDSNSNNSNKTVTKTITKDSNNVED